MTAFGQTRHGFEFACDSCGEVWEPPKLGLGSQPREFGESWELAKEDGWRCFKGRHNQWEHRCPDC